MFKGHWPSSRPGQKSLTFHAWTHLPGKAGLFEQLSKLKRKKAAANKDQQKSEWSAEKSVRFTLPPSEVKRRSRVVTFIPNTEEVERPTFWDLRRNYSLEAFDCWTSTQCPKCCQKCSSSPYVNEAFPKRPSIRPNKKVLEILPDYTDDEQEAFQPQIVKPPSYPSGSMTLPKPAVKKHTSPNTASSEVKVTFKGLSPPPEVKKATPENSPSPVTKPNESGESDPGYESDSSKSKNHEDPQVSQQPQQQQQQIPQQQSQQQQQQQNKACTLPRRSAKVSVQPPSSTLDRRKLRNLADSEAGVTVEIISPIRLEHRDVAASQTLRAALSKVEQAHPGFSYDFVLGLVRKADANNVNMNESLLRLQGAVSDQDCIEYRSSRTEEPFQELNKKSIALKRILARIPEEISDRKTFLETIKEIASAIKKLLDAVNEVSAYIPGTSGKQALDQKKREFVKYSKRFSNTLKEFFRDGQPTPVFTSATYLIYQTNQVMITVKDKCE